ncbi:MAG: hypothetical protein LBV28_02810 [Puniceicoccales bacterium]|jgi:hypothetical protein|nr:hypothetical protein [Puniceicoccales bacterium]
MARPFRNDDPRHTARSTSVVHPHSWIWEPLENEASFVLRNAFGAKSVYLNGQQHLCCCAGEEPWRGVLVCTSKEHHAALIRDFPALTPHPVLGKWLYLPEADDDFEETAARIVKLISRRDPRIGVVGKPRRRPRASSPKHP